MTRSVYAPGRDEPPSSDSDHAITYGSSPQHPAGGVFANYIQGATPKYAVNSGMRGDFFRNTLARMFVRVDEPERGALFLPSIGDSFTKNVLAPRLTGDPRPQRSGNETGTETNANQRRAPSPAQGNGYLDFLITQVQHSLNEKYATSETLADNSVTFFFGQTTPVWQYSGMLINTVQDDQATNFFRLYTEILRGTQMARRQKTVSLVYDAFIVTGVMVNLNLAYKSDNELLVPFSFQLLVKKVGIINSTTNWSPTSATSAFAADFNAIPYDGSPRVDAGRSDVAARPAEGTTETTPTGRTDADTRTATTAPAGANAVTARPETVAPAPTLVDRSTNALSNIANPLGFLLPLRF